MSEMRKCKECGKMFMPKGREQYCSDTHYRPCPICGEPVIAKYLSDPPRKCDKCRGRKVSSNNASKQNSSSMTIKPMQVKSLFNIDSKKFDVPSMKIPQVKEKVVETKEKVVISEEKVVETKVKTNNFKRKGPAPATIDQAVFCEKVSGSIMKYIGKPNISKYIPGHDYLINVIHEGYIYLVKSEEDVTLNDTAKNVTMCASQISFHQNFADPAELE